MLQLASPPQFRLASVDAPTLPRAESVKPSRAPRTVQPEPLLQFDDIVPKGNRSLAYRAVKRAMDLAGGLLLLAALSPVLLVTLLVLLVTTKGRPFYRQRRVGFCGRVFWMYKFRTMCLDAESKQHLVQNEQQGPVFKNRHDPRVTRVGRWLRRLSIDEMPQLINVLRGEMALVGPRPAILHEARFKSWQLDRLAVKPGLTCLWQVSGRCEIGFDDWMAMDVWYVQHQNLATDLKLLWKTPLSVLSGRGAY